MYSDHDANNEVRVSHYVRSVNIGTKSFRGLVHALQRDADRFCGGSDGHCAHGMAHPAGRRCADRTVLRADCDSHLVRPIGLCFHAGGHHRTGIPESARSDSRRSLAGISQCPSNTRPVGRSEHQLRMATTIGGFVVVEGTRSLLYFGRNGTGAACYGDPTSDQALAGTKSPDGATYCYDPAVGGKGAHAFPYVFQVWADHFYLALVKAGKSTCGDRGLYATWPVSFPPALAVSEIGGVGYELQASTALRPAAKWRYRRRRVPPDDSRPQSRMTRRQSAPV